MRDKRDGAITCVFCSDLHLTLMFFPVFYENMFQLVTQGLPSSFLFRPVAYRKLYTISHQTGALQLFGAPLNSFRNESCEES